MSNGFAGVTLPDNIGETQQDSASEPSGAASQESGNQGAEKSQATEQRDQAQSPATSMVDLDKLECFRFGGRELTAKQLRDETLLRQDYTKKTAEVAEARKYADNFHYDLSHVVANPSLLDKFKEIYPKEYIEIAEKILSQRGQQAGNQSVEQKDPATPTRQPLPLEFQEAMKDVKEWKAQVQEQKVQATLEQINSMHQRMETKFPYADPDVVDTRLQIALEKGLEITKDNLSQVIEQAYKQHHEAVKARIDGQQKIKVEEQVKAGKQARDIGTGGSPAGGAPKKYKKLSEVSQDMEAALTGK